MELFNHHNEVSILAQKLPFLDIFSHLTITQESYPQDAWIRKRTRAAASIHGIPERNFNCTGYDCSRNCVDEYLP